MESLKGAGARVGQQFLCCARLLLSSFGKKRCIWPIGKLAGRITNMCSCFCAHNFTDTTLIIPVFRCIHVMNALVFWVPKSLVEIFFFFNASKNKNYG